MSTANATPSTTGVIECEGRISLRLRFDLFSAAIFAGVRTVAAGFFFILRSSRSISAAL